jgi:uncharacterized phosphosugar-binding protein
MTGQPTRGRYLTAAHELLGRLEDQLRNRACEQALLGRDRAQTPHSSGTRLIDHADVVLDLGTPPGDAMVDISGLPTPVGPGSSLAAIALVNEIKVQTAQLLVDRGAMPPVLTSPAIVGAEESARLFDAAYAEHGERVARLFRVRPQT